MSIETSYQILANSNSPDAADVLATGIDRGDPETKARCIVASAGLRDSASHEKLIDGWDRFRDSIPSAFPTHSHPNPAPYIFNTVVSHLNNATHPERYLSNAIEMAVAFGILRATPGLIQLAIIHPSRSIRRLSLKAVNEMSLRWGHEARGKHNPNRSFSTLDRQRFEVARQLLEVVCERSQNSQEEFLDAFIAISRWDDPTLKLALKDGSRCQTILLQRMHDSSNRGVMDLLVGFLSRRAIPESIIGVAWKRVDQAFRDCLLGSIVPRQSPYTIKYFREHGLPDCLRGGLSLLRDVSPDHDVAIAHVYSSATRPNPETLLLLTEIVQRHSPGGNDLHDSVAICMSRCIRPDFQYWIGALDSPLLEQVDSPNDLLALSPNDSAAIVCRRLIAILQSSHAGLAKQAGSLLAELNIQNALPRFQNLSRDQQRRLGQTLLKVDESTLTVVRDRLRHAVMNSRLDAIAFAQTVGLVDSFIQPLTQMARHDFQAVRLAATKAFGHASGKASGDLLKEFSSSSQGSIRDAATASLQMRGLLE